MSKRRMKVIVDGKPYLVEVGDLTNSPITVSVNGRSYLVNIETGELEVAPAATEDTTAREASAPGLADAAGPLVNQVRAPMPGNILNIVVKPGDRVRLRQQLCTLEAMKMMNAIRSPQDGLIASVEVTEGQAVAHGEVLLTFEEDAQQVEND